MKLKKHVCILLLFVIFTALFTSCAEEAPEDTGNTEPPLSDSVQTPDTTEPVIHLPEHFNPLTGEEADKDISALRPVAIVLNNTQRAAPQLGLGAADLVYEIPVEGGLTRLMAIFSDYSAVPKIGPIYDSRAYCFDFAAQYDAIVIQAGMNDTAKEAFKNNEKLDLIDGVTMYLPNGFERDKTLIEERGYGNSMVTNGSMIASSIAKQEYRTTLSESIKPPFHFVEYLENRNMAVSNSALKVTIPYSGSHAPYFVYSTLTDSYIRYQFGAVHTDGNTGKDLRFTNIMILQMTFSEIDEKTGEMAIDTAGEGAGYYVYGGKCIPILWRSTDGQSIDYYESDGTTPLIIARGKTYVSIISERLKNRIAFE